VLSTVWTGGPTRGALIALDAATTELGFICNTLPHRDTSFTVRNIGFVVDSITLVVDPVNVIPETAIEASPVYFYLASTEVH
jgi:hypothetical protein